MELELKAECLEAFDLCGNTAFTQEETAETIVPDYCPDIARIITADGAVFIHSRDIRDGKGILSGSVRVHVLYTPEGEAGIRLFEFAMPFTMEAESSGLTGCDHLSAACKIELLESRMLNPRKIFTRCKLIALLEGYQKQPMRFCSDLIAEPALCLEKNQATCQATLLKQIAEKDFTFTDTILLSPGRQGAAELLNHTLHSSITEKKLIGNKLIFKGIFFTQLLYRATDGQICSSSFEMPFSQIMEMEDATENAHVALQLQLTGVDLQIDSGDPEGREIAAAIYFHVMAIVREEQSVTLLQDLYSTAYETSYETAPVSICSLYEEFARRQTVREVLEIGVTAASILSAKVSCGAVSVSREGELSVFRANAAVQVLYLDEGGTCLTAERTMEVTLQTELPLGCQITADAFCVEDVQSSIGERGIEVRFVVDFQAEIRTKSKKISIIKATLDQNSVKDLSSAPSLVLRYIDPNESAWELAKKYNTTISEILSANQLECETALPSEKLMLIPRKRS